MKNSVQINKLAAFDGLEIKKATFRQKAFPAHYHDAYALAMIEQGAENLTFGERTITIAAQQLVVINPYELHSHANFDNDVWSYKALYLSEDVLQYFLKQFHLKANSKLHFPNIALNNPSIIKNFQNIDNQCNINTNIAKLLFSLLPIAIENPIRNEAPILHWCDDAKVFLRNKRSEKISLEDLAARFATDKFTFLRQFKRATGITPNHFLLLERVAYAKMLLLQSELSLTAVALESGFYDQSHFIHTFKKHVGVPPSEYNIY